jgi:hypothetical protein
MSLAYDCLQASMMDDFSVKCTMVLISSAPVTMSATTAEPQK